MRVIGIDGCRKGWLGIVTDGGGVEALFAPRVADLERPPARGGTAQSLPARPEEMTPGGRPMAIWA